MMRTGAPTVCNGSARGVAQSPLHIRTGQLVSRNLDGSTAKASISPKTVPTIFSDVLLCYELSGLARAKEEREAALIQAHAWQHQQVHERARLHDGSSDVQAANMGLDLELAVEIVKASSTFADDACRCIDQMPDSGFDGDVGNAFAKADLICIRDT
nr:hypothetical protein [Polaromonas sp.]